MQVKENGHQVVMLQVLQKSTQAVQREHKTFTNVMSGFSKCDRDGPIGGASALFLKLLQ